MELQKLWRVERSQMSIAKGLVVKIKGISDRDVAKAYTGSEDT